jgi:hypothetical protein
MIEDAENTLGADGTPPAVALVECRAKVLQIARALRDLYVKVPM